MCKHFNCIFLHDFNTLIRISNHHFTTHFGNELAMKLDRPDLPAGLGNGLPRMGYFLYIACMIPTFSAFRI